MTITVERTQIVSIPVDGGLGRQLTLLLSTKYWAWQVTQATAL